MADKNYDSDDSDEVEKVTKAGEATPVAPPEDTNLTNPDVCTKYQEAAKIAQAALLEVTAKCVAGAKIVDVCRFGDELIEAKAASIFKGKSKTGKIIMKGVAFPVCLSVNDVVCHCSPLESDNTYAPLAENDLVKIDLGVHVDGFIAVVAHTITVPAAAPPTAAPAAAGAATAAATPSPAAAAVASLSPEQIAKRTQVMNAAYAAAEVAVRLMKPGNTNHHVTTAIKQVADLYQVKPIAGTLMHQMKQFVIDGNKMILLRDDLPNGGAQDGYAGQSYSGSGSNKVETCTFESGEVYAIDIAMSSGDGRPRETGNRTTIHKRAVEKKYSLKSKSSRMFFNDVNKKYPTLPFTLRSLPDETAARLGIRECVLHELLLPYPVLNERKDDVLVHVKVTVLLLPSGNTAQITGLPPSTYVSLVQSGTLPATISLPEAANAAEKAATPPTPPSTANMTPAAAMAATLASPPAALPALTAFPPAEGLANKLSASLPIALTLLSDLQAKTSPTAYIVPENIVKLLEMTTAESKKKAKKSAAATKKAATASEGGVMSVGAPAVRDDTPVTK